jgi:hypothetical protein
VAAVVEAGVDEQLIPFRVSNDALAEPSQLASHFHSDGYLFFRGVLDSSLVAGARREFIDVLRAHDIVDPAADEPVWTGRGIEDFSDEPLYGSSAYLELIGSAELQAVLDASYGEPAHITPSVGIRYALPENRVYETPPHQDHFFIRRMSEFRMIWIPLMDIPLEGGGLAIAAGSNQLGLLDHLELQDRQSYTFKGRKQRGIPLESIDLPWAASDYHPGDLLMFASLAVHRALPNQSGNVRLSINTLTHPDRLPRMWQAEQSQLYLRAYRARCRELCDAEGADEATFEAVHIEMQRQGADLGPEVVRAAIAQLASTSA